MERSSELEAVIRRYLHAVDTADLETVRASIHPGAGTVILGSDPVERVVGAEAVDFLVASAQHRRSDYIYDVNQVDAFEHGSTGWVAVEAVARFNTEHRDPGLSYDDIQMRLTAVLTLERGRWQIVLWHFSTPTPDDPTVSGAELTEAMYEMMSALAENSQVKELTTRLNTNTVSLVFTDVVGSTERTGEAGDEAWARIITRHLADIERVATEHGGFVVKTTGDGAMVAFGSARRAVLAAAEMRSSVKELDTTSPLSIRVGVHIGEAVKAESDYFGQTVNEAARIMSAAEPDQILVSDVVRSLVGDVPNLAFGHSLNLELKGIPGSRKVHPLL